MMAETKVIEDICSKASRADYVFLLLDYDGTLVPFAPTPAEARPDSPLLSLLERLARAPRLRVALVSGRATEDLRGLISIPGLYLAGGHGSEIIMPGGETRSLIDEAHIPHIRQMIQEVKELASAVVSGREGFLFEDKGSSFAIHYRLADPRHAAEVVADFIERAEKLLASPSPVKGSPPAKGDLPARGNSPARGDLPARGRQADGRDGGQAGRHPAGIEFELLRGHKLLEVRPVGVNKGEAVRRLVDLMKADLMASDLMKADPAGAVGDNTSGPRDGARGEATQAFALPIYVGDDTTDEDAFRALESDGIGVLVSEEDRPTHAQYRLGSPESVRRFLRALIPPQVSQTGQEGHPRTIPRRP